MYVVFMKCEFQGVENNSWYQLLTKWKPDLEKFTLGISSYHLESLLETQTPVTFKSKEKALQVAQLIKIHESANNTEKWKPNIKISKFYVLNTSNKEHEEV